MKKTELATIVLIASISMIIAYLTTQSLLGSVTTESVKVKTIDSIGSSFEEPSKDIFNSNAINPTVEVQITNNGS